ncbi:MAG: hypothetical protein B6I31_01395 [Desulfobacteraceae bacterium 4572_19]|nr:MAG: hypothetical protein B6I31_01395 [Desulfobacteraceae bacterium 4572_19]
MGYETTHICATIILYDRQLRKVVIATAGNPGGLLVTTDLNGNLSFYELAGGGLCMGLLERQDLFIEEERILEENSWLFHFSDGIEQEHIREVLLSEPNILKRNSAKGLGLSIIKKIIKNHGQDDDMILLTTYTPSNL